MEGLGYGPDKRLVTKISTRNLAAFKDPAVIVGDQLKTIYIDGDLDTGAGPPILPSARSALPRAGIKTLNKIGSPAPRSAAPAASLTDPARPRAIGSQRLAC